MRNERTDGERVLALYGTASCRYTAELREDLRWQGRPFEEYDVEADEEARKQMLDLTGGGRMVPVLVDGEEIVQVGVGGRGCYVGGATG